jgi:rsbT co-antagonist protein RsbR
VEQLLNSIVNTQASIVIIDITGVPVIDTAVANHLIKTTQAARMLGADTIITGISPANAQTLVTLGVDLSMMTTKGSLRSGVKLADGMLKLVVVEKR